MGKYNKNEMYNEKDHLIMHTVSKVYLEKDDRVHH